MVSEQRTRGVLEVVTAILLGLVSVATAVGAYQAGAWAQQAGELTLVSQQARDRNLALYLERDAISDDDGVRLFDATALYAEWTFYPEREEALRADQELIIAAASPALQAGWQPFVDSGFDASLLPLVTPEYQAFTYAEPQSYNITSAIADRSSDVLVRRSHAMAVVSVVFALALLMLGVAGVSSRLGVSAIMTGGGGVAFLAGVAGVIFGVF